MTISKVAILGCGVIGSSWIEAFHSAGLQIHAWDPQPEVMDTLSQRYGKGVHPSPTPEDAIEGVDFIQENGPESVEGKRAIFARLQASIGETTIVASSTSTIMASTLQQGLNYGSRLLVGHPFNPPHLIPLVEIVGGTMTEEWVVSAAANLYTRLGKHVIQLHRERAGHLANRLQAALWREAVDAVASGQASVEDVDAAVTMALGPRWAIHGPFGTFNLGGGAGGLEHFLDHLGPAFEALWDDARRPEVSVELRRELILGIARMTENTSINDLIRNRDNKLREILAIVRP